MPGNNDPFGKSNSAYDTLVNGISKQVNDNRIAWHIDAVAVAGISPFLTEWRNKWGVSKNRKTCSTADREATKRARKSLSAYLRPFVQVWIHRNESMTPANVTACGLRPHMKTKPRVGKPKTEPALEFKTAGTHVLGVYFRQQAGEDGASRRGKPDGTCFCKIAYFIGENPPEDPDDFTKVVMATRSPHKLVFTPADAGKLITIASCWVSVSNIDGNWNTAKGTRIP